MGKCRDSEIAPTETDVVRCRRELRFPTTVATHNVKVDRTVVLLKQSVNPNPNDYLEDVSYAETVL